MDAVRSADRHLDWDGCGNVRDLGGLRTVDGFVTRRGALVRADAVDRLTAHGWAALDAHGVRTVIDLRNDEERRPDAAPRPARLRTVQLPLDAAEDAEFWDVWGTGPQFGTPLYYGPFLDRFPQRAGRVIAAIARAPAGGVLFHCGGGRDRAGLITILVLALVGVAPDDIAADYELSHARLSRLFALRGEEDPGPLLAAFLADQRTSASEVIVSTLAALDVEARLRAGGVREDDVDALRARLLIVA